MVTKTNFNTEITNITKVPGLSGFEKKTNIDAKIFAAATKFEPKSGTAPFLLFTYNMINDKNKIGYLIHLLSKNYFICFFIHYLKQ